MGSKGCKTLDIAHDIASLHTRQLGAELPGRPIIGTYACISPRDDIFEQKKVDHQLWFMQ